MIKKEAPKDFLAFGHNPALFSRVFCWVSSQLRISSLLFLGSFSYTSSTHGQQRKSYSRPEPVSTCCTWSCVPAPRRYTSPEASSCFSLFFAKSDAPFLKDCRGCLGTGLNCQFDSRIISACFFKKSISICFVRS